VRRGHEPKVSPFQAGLLSIVILVIATYFVFAKAIPFRHHYEVRAVMANANLVQPR
jgi:phospholipid/cholesterol/gamma-HCH transport system substrate-binding protein